VIAYLLRRLRSLLALLVGLSIFSFMLGQFAPGDPAYSLALLDTGGPPSPEYVDVKAHELGLDDPLIVQYGTWVKDAVTGDLGKSLRTGHSVTGSLRHALPITVQLGLLTFLIVLAVGIPLGVLAALRHGRFSDHSSRLLSLAGASLPSYWFGYLLITAFSLRLGLFPTSGVSSPSAYVLPAITLSLFATSVMVRITRASMLEVLGEEFIASARARGVPERRIVVRHALRVALNPVVTYGGLVLGGLLSGTVFVETVFAMPGLGKLVVDAINGHDFPVVQGFVLLVGTLVLVVNLAVDLLYAALDPRVRIVQGQGAEARAG
jgi:ABC-type dipeptide/oligopeptide/nickel transport system permease component